jgi:hypothetical protein
VYQQLGAAVVTVFCGCPVPDAAAACSYVVMHLAKLGGWQVYAVSRKDKLQYEDMPEGLGDSVTPVQVSWPGQQ